MSWKENILTTDADIAALLRDTKRIAVLGIKPEDHAGQPAFYVPKYMQQAGCEVVPVPVYYPEVTEILGEKVYRKLSDIPGEIDMINVFRRSKDVFQHVEAMIARKPKSVWLQLGIRDDDSAERMAKAGIKVVQDLCLMVEYRALVR
jgi:predicted CoA-binding protein